MSLQQKRETILTKFLKTSAGLSDSITWSVRLRAPYAAEDAYWLPDDWFGFGCCYGLVPGIPPCEFCKEGFDDILSKYLG